MKRSPLALDDDAPVVRTVVLAGLVLLVGLLTTETVFRTLVFPQWRALQTANLVHHPVYGTFQKPNMEVRRFSPPNYDVINRTNGLGFRDRQQDFESEDLAGIWLAGSSNTFGAGIEDDDLYSAVVEGLGYRAANLASEGHKLWNQVLVVRHLASLGYRPRAVILEMTMNNTLIDVRRHMDVFDRPLASADADEAPQKGPLAVLRGNIDDLASRFRFNLHAIKTKLINNSAIYGWLKVGINGIPLLREKMLAWGLRADVADASGGPIELMRDMADNPTDELISGTAAFIARLRAWVRAELDAPLGVIIIPNQYQLAPERLSRLALHRGIDPGQLDAGRPARLFAEALAANGIPALNLTKPILAHDLKRYSFPDDAHVTPAVHRIIAENLADWLERELRVPKHP